MRSWFNVRISSTVVYVFWVYVFKYVISSTSQFSIYTLYQNNINPRMAEKAIIWNWNLNKTSRSKLPRRNEEHRLSGPWLRKARGTARRRYPWCIPLRYRWWHFVLDSNSEGMPLSYLADQTSGIFCWHTDHLSIMACSSCSLPVCQKRLPDRWCLTKIPPWGSGPVFPAMHLELVVTLISIVVLTMNTKFASSTLQKGSSAVRTLRPCRLRLFDGVQKVEKKVLEMAQHASFHQHVSYNLSTILHALTAGEFSSVRQPIVQTLFLPFLWSPWRTLLDVHPMYLKTAYPSYMRAHQWACLTVLCSTVVGS